MRKSNEIKKLNELPDIDYSNLPKEVEESLTKEPYTVTTKAKLTWDGKQFIVRIPSEISQEMKLTNEKRMLFTLVKPVPDSDDEIDLKIEII